MSNSPHITDATPGPLVSGSPPRLANPWDRAARGYLTEWVPRFVPYHRNLITELTLREGHRVLVVGAGPGSEAIAAAREVGPTGHVRATDSSGGMVALCTEQVARAGLTSTLASQEADAADITGGPWDAVISAFGLWQLPDATRTETVRAWGNSLAPGGKVGVLTWGPADQNGPFELLSASLREVVPAYRQTNRQNLAERGAMQRLFEEAGLDLVRLTVVRHPHTFKTAEQFFHSLRDACTWRAVWEELGTETLDRVASTFFHKVGGPETPLHFEPAATLAIAARAGDAVTLAARATIG